ncbi:hypothetical protein V3N99_11070 [Dermatophilaceae bacterium Soc4.6]
MLDRLLTLGDRLRLVRGNADRDLVTLARGGTLPEGTPPIDRWAAAQLRPDHVGLLADLPHPLVLPLTGVGDVLFCHGTPATTTRSCSSTPGRRAGSRCWRMSRLTCASSAAVTRTRRTPGWDA